MEVEISEVSRGENMKGDGGFSGRLFLGQRGSFKYLRSYALVLNAHCLLLTLRKVRGSV